MTAVLLIFSAVAFAQIANAAVLLSDDFTGTTIDTNKWTEVDAGGLGGTVGNIKQNNTLTLAGSNAWGANHVVTKDTYDRSSGTLSMEADITCTNAAIIGIGYGDPGVLTGGGQSYTLYTSSNKVYFSRQNSNVNAENIASSFTCTPGTPFHVKITIGASSGASLYINNSPTPNVTLTGGTFNNKPFFISSYSGSPTPVDNFTINDSPPVISEPDAPTGLNAVSADSQVSLSWLAPQANGSPITDYIVEYKLSSEPVTWSTFNDGVSTNTSAVITGLDNGYSYDFRVKAVNSIGTGPGSGVIAAMPVYPTFSDDFTGTTIDTNKWTEVDAGGLGGTVGNVRQNGALSVTPIGGSWANQNGVKTVGTYDRTDGDLTMQVSVTRDSCGTGSAPVAVGYGDMNFTTAGSASYILIADGTNWDLYYWLNGTNQSGSPQRLSGVTSCTNGVPTTFKLAVLKTGGAKVYVNNSNTAAATISAGSFTNKQFWIGGLNPAGSIAYDDVSITEPIVGPVRPTGLSGTAGDEQVNLSWSSGGDNGSPITDYVIEYKLNSDGSWSTLNDGTSTNTSANITGLTNGALYNFRVRAINGNGSSVPSSIFNATPVSPIPAAPAASSVSISGSTFLGDMLTGDYVFNDANGDDEGTSLFRWLRADTVNGVYSPISGASGKTYILTASDIGKYIKFEVTPVADAAPMTGSAVASSATNQIEDADYINSILSTGQSLSVGVASTPALSTTQPYNNVMLHGANGGMGLNGSFIPLVEGSVETMSSSMANSITANVPGNNYDVAVALHGVSGYTYSQLKKNTAPYNKGINQLGTIKAAAAAQSRQVRAIGVTAIHGETDNYNNVSGATYKGYLEDWQQDYETSIKAVTGQSGTVPFFTDQMSSFMAPYANDATSEIPIYQFYASRDNPGKIVLVTPKYFFNYSDQHHLTGQSTRWLGEYYGKVIKKVSVDHQPWKPLSPTSSNLVGNDIFVDFHVPSGNLVFDTTMVSPRNNMGFEYYDSTSSATIQSVTIVDSDTVKVSLSNTPTGSNQRIRYAYTGVPGTNTNPQNAGSAAGNLRDTDAAPSLYGNTLYNWAVHFDEPITAQSSAPGTPTSLATTRGNTQVALTWTAPSSDGGAAITDYIVQYKETSSGTWSTFADGTSTNTNATVTGLTNGTQYDFRVRAVNSVGEGTNSSTESATPATTPSAPTVTANPASSAVALTWTAPSSDGGAAITDYIVQYKETSSGTWSTFADGTSTNTNATVTGLTNGTQYDFRVAAVNAVGTGTNSSTATATPATTPGAPTPLTTTRANTQVALTWTAPSSDGGSAITDYIVQYKASAGSTWNTFNDGTSTGTNATVTGLDNGTQYDFRVAAKNSVDTGDYSSVESATPATTPSAATSLTATRANTQVSLAWTAPSSNGGSAITDYKVQYKESSSSTWQTFADGTSTNTSATVTGLTNGTQYDFRVRAVNSVGESPNSSTASAKPATMPSAPSLSATPETTGMKLTWTAPNSGGEAITDYTVQFKKTSASTWSTFSDGTSTGTTVTVTGLEPGTSYDFQVAAKNSLGTGSFSSPQTATTLANAIQLTNPESSQPIILTTPSSTDLTCHSTVRESSLAKQDSQFSYPLGLVDFCFDTSDSDNQVSLLFVTNLKPSDVVARKYDPTTKQFASIPDATITETTVNGQHALRLTYTIADNGPLDQDPTTGQIKDPAGLGLKPSSGNNSGSTGNSGSSAGSNSLKGGAPNTGLENKSQLAQLIALIAGIATLLGVGGRKLYLKRK